MFVTIFSIFGIVSILIIIAGISYFLGMNKSTEEVVKKIKMKAPNPFDQVIMKEENGMNIINKYISTEFNKFLHNKLIGIIEEKGGMPFTHFLADMKNADNLIPFISGFIAYLWDRMSDDLKNFFNKYYKVLDKEGEMSNHFSDYISEWVNIKIRSIQAQMIVPESGGIMSTQEQNELDNKLLLRLEFEIYEDLGIMTKPNVTNIAPTGGK